MWQIQSDQARPGGYVAPRPVVFQPIPPSTVLAQVHLQRRPAPADQLEPLVYRPVADAVAQAEADDEACQRAARLQQEHQEHEKAAALAGATLAEVRARRQRQELEAKPGLAGRLVTLQREADAAQRSLAEAQELAAQVGPALASARQQVAERRRQALAGACQERSLVLEAERRAVLARLAEVASPLLDQLWGIEAAIQVCRTPTLVENALDHSRKAAHPAEPAA